MIGNIAPPSVTGNKDLNSPLMALSLGVAMLCYAVSIYLILRPPKGGQGPVR